MKFKMAAAAILNL